MLAVRCSVWLPLLVLAGCLDIIDSLAYHIFLASQSLVLTRLVTSPRASSKVLPLPSRVQYSQIARMPSGCLGSRPILQAFRIVLGMHKVAPFCDVLHGWLVAAMTGKSSDLDNPFPSLRRRSRWGHGKNMRWFGTFPTTMHHCHCPTGRLLSTGHNSQRLTGCMKYRARSGQVTMRLIHTIFMFAVITVALPSSTQDSNAPQLDGIDGALMTSGQCHLGQHYCFSQIVGDLGISFHIQLTIHS